MYQVFRFACLRRKHLNGKLKLDVYVGVLKRKQGWEQVEGNGTTGRGRGRKRGNEERGRQRKGSSEVRGQKEKIIRYRS